ncbi:MAG: efflux RND transporter periplasmic adaptor subunit [Gammaproteobacteria bacterium]|nr:efflux RND transporter periplasmic adaptor subunit [Gammaproteobacteria bacterium]
MRQPRTLLWPALLAVAGCGGGEPFPAPAPLPDLPTFEVTAATTTAGRGWDGVIEAVQRADLSAQTAGRISAVEVDVSDQVAAGDVLVRISAIEQDAGTATARAQWRVAEAAAVEAELNFRRVTELAERQFVSQAQIDQSKAARDAALARRDAAQAQARQVAQQSVYTVIRAPFAGVVAARAVEPGETVAPGQPLLRLHAPAALRIEVAVPQGSAAAIRRDPRAVVALADGREVVPASVIVYPAADPISHSINVRAVLPDLVPAPAPGTTAKVSFAADPERAADAAPVSIPVTAVVQRGEVSGVYVRQGDRLLLRQLRLGARRGDRVEVISGLRAGELVVRDPVAATQALARQREAMHGRDD